MPGADLDEPLKPLSTSPAQGGICTACLGWKAQEEPLRKQGPAVPKQKEQIPRVLQRVYAPNPGTQRLSGLFWRASPMRTGRARSPSLRSPTGLQRKASIAQNVHPRTRESLALPVSCKKTCSLTRRKEQNKNGQIFQGPCKSHHYHSIFSRCNRKLDPRLSIQGSLAKVAAGISGQQEGSLVTAACAHRRVPPQPAPSPALPGTASGNASHQLPKLETSLFLTPHAPNSANSSSLLRASGAQALLSAPKVPQSPAL